MGKTNTYYAAKWFVRRPKTELVEVSIADPLHRLHWQLKNLGSVHYGAKAHDRAEFVRRYGPQTRVVPIEGETVLTGIFQSGFQEYPEPLVRTKDPQGTPDLCRAGWHVPYLSTLAAFVKNVDGLELWLVKVGGKHTSLSGNNKVAFKYIELRRKLELGQVVRLMDGVSQALANPGPGAPRFTSRGTSSWVHSAEEKLLDTLRELDRVGPRKGKFRAPKGTGRHLLLNPASVGKAEAGETLHL